jgi:hypothetical protein
MAEEAGPASAVAEEEPKPKVSRCRNLLSMHVTEAVFTGFEEGREPMLRVQPPRPAKRWAAFEIANYVSYGDYGDYADPKQEKFAFVPEEQESTIAAALAGISVGDRCALEWRHENVSTFTTLAGKSTKTQGPERVVIHLAKLGPGERATNPEAEHPE